jgi:hypothetical protein
MLAAFQVGRGDSSVDACAQCCDVSYVTIAEQVTRWVSVMAVSSELRPVAVLASGVFSEIFLAAATIHTATGARAASAILKRSRRKK